MTATTTGKTFDTKAAGTTTARSVLGLALATGVAALAGCSTSGDDTAIVAPTGGPTQAVARGFKLKEVTTNPAPGVTNTSTTATVNLANARNGEQVILNVTDATPANGATAAVPGSVTLRGSGATATPSLTLDQFGETTTAANDPDNPVGKDITTRFFGTPSVLSTAADPEGADGKDQLVVIDAEYARIAFGGLAPTEENGQQAGLSYIAGAKASDVERAVPKGGTATYAGGGLVSALGGGDAELFEGEVEIRADFGAGTVAGEIDFDGADERMLLRDGRIDGTDYEGKVALVDPTGARTYTPDSADNNGRNAFRGGFYGPNAEETVGVVDYRGTVTEAGTTDRIDAFGNYIAVKQPAPTTP